MHFRRKHIADERIAQRDQVHVRRDEKSRKMLERNQARSIKGYASRAKFTFDPISLRSRGIQPEPKTELRLPKVFGVCFDECVVIVGNAPVTRVKDDPGSIAQIVWQRQRAEPRREFHGRGVALQTDALLRDAAVRESPSLVEAQHFESINSTSPELCDPQQ